MGIELDFSWPVFKLCAFYTSILVFKLMSLSFLRVALQFRRQMVLQDENRDLLERREIITGYDLGIQRTIRAEDDDIKQIIPFCILALIYCFTHPSPVYAGTIFKLFTAARIFYSIVYAVNIIREPIRAVVWSIGTLLNFYMCFKIFFYFI